MVEVGCQCFEVLPATAVPAVLPLYPLPMVATALAAPIRLATAITKPKFPARKLTVETTTTTMAEPSSATTPSKGPLAARPWHP